MERRLAAILATDIVGYSRLMGADEAGTLAAVTARRMEIIEPKVKQYNGRIVKLMGDGALLEFASAVDAVAFAVEVQGAMAERNWEVPKDRQILYRIGINIGDIIVEGDDIHGDGVNVAARLEGLAEPGGICIARNVFNHIKNKLDVKFRDIGEQTLKNIAEPIRAYQIVIRDKNDGSVTVEREGRPAIPDKPSIAVLPFANMSGDPEQECFADGMTEDIITALSRFRLLFVIARNSTFAYKGTAPDVRTVGRDLGVRYVLEGSVQRSGARIRITSQLIDAEMGSHLWAERYDRELQDIFDVQDEVTQAIVAAIAPEISDVERERARRKPPGSLEAWDIYQRGLADYHASTDESFHSAIEQFDRVNEIDPTFAPAFAMAAGARVRYVLHFEPEDRARILDEAQEKAQTAVSLDPRDPLCLWVDGRVHSMFGRHDAAISRSEEAVALNPNDAMSHLQLGVVLCTAGRTKDAISPIDQAIRLSPRDIFLVGMLTHRAFCLFDLERYEEAFEWMQRARHRTSPRTMTFALYAAILTRLGRQEEAKEAIGDLLAHAPEMSCAKYRANQFGAPEAMERFADALREAGLPQ